MKSYTSLEQSKKLAKILPIESADMFYVAGKGEPIFIGNKMVAYGDDDYDALGEPDVLCWSLAALLGILAEQDFIIKSLERNNEYQYNIDIPSRHCKIWFSSLLDAAFEMVCWLKENNKL